MGAKTLCNYWGYETIKSIIPNKLLPPKTPSVAFGLGCPSDYFLPNGNGRCCNPFTGNCIDEPTGNPPTPTPTPTPVPQGCPSGYLPNGQGMCCRPGTNDCVSEGSSGGGTPTPSPTPTPVPQGCPSGYLPNGQGMCCRPGTNDCVSEGSSGGGNNGGGNPAPNSTLPFIGCPDGYLPNGQGQCCEPGTNNCVQEATPQNGKTWKKVVRVEVGPATNSTQQNCQLIYSCKEWYSCSYSPAYPANGVDCQYSHTDCKSSLECGAGNGDSGNMPPVGTGGTTGGSGNTGGECINGYRNGTPCGEPICGNNGYNQYSQKCGRNCNTTTGYDQFGDPCGPSVCEIGILHPESTGPNSARVASVTIDQYGHECIIPLTPGFRTKSFDCDVLKHLWSNSFRNGSVYQENAVVFTENGSYLQPLSGNSCGNGPTSNTSHKAHFDFLGCFTKDATGTYYTPTNSFESYKVIAVVHTHPSTINGNNFIPSDPDRESYSKLNVPSYIIGNTGVIQYTDVLSADGYTPIKSMQDLQNCAFKIR